MSIEMHSGQKKMEKIFVAVAITRSTLIILPFNPYSFNHVLSDLETDTVY